MNTDAHRYIYLQKANSGFSVGQNGRLCLTNTAAHRAGYKKIVLRLLEYDIIISNYIVSGLNSNSKNGKL